MKLQLLKVVALSLVATLFGSTCPAQNYCQQAGFSAGADLLVLKVFHTRDPGTLNGQQPEYDYEAAPRVWLGLMGEDGVGIRTRYFHIDSTSERIVDGTDFLEFSAEYQTVDLEMTYQSVFSNWCLLGSGGIKYAKLEGLETDEFSQRQSKFEGYGPTGSLELQRRCRGVTPFVSGRASLLMGDYFNSTNDEPATNTIYETQIGFQFSKCCRFGEFVARTALESHYSPLMGTTYETGSDNEEDNMAFGLLGGMFSLEMRF